jgi:hypothetical protein
MTLFEMGNKIKKTEKKMARDALVAGNGRMERRNNDGARQH